MSCLSCPHVKSVHVSLIIGSCCEIHSPIISRNMFSALCLPSAIVLRGNPEIRMFLNLSCQFLYLGFNGQRVLQSVAAFWLKILVCWQYWSCILKPLGNNFALWIIRAMLLSSLWRIYFWGFWAPDTWYFCCANRCEVFFYCCLKASFGDVDPVP